MSTVDTRCTYVCMHTCIRARVLARSSSKISRERSESTKKKQKKLMPSLQGFFSPWQGPSLRHARASARGIWTAGPSHGDPNHNLGQGRPTRITPAATGTLHWAPRLFGSPRPKVFARRVTPPTSPPPEGKPGVGCSVAVFRDRRAQTFSRRVCAWRARAP